MYNMTKTGLRKLSFCHQISHNSVQFQHDKMQTIDAYLIED